MVDCQDLCKQNGERHSVPESPWTGLSALVPAQVSLKIHLVRAETHRESSWVLFIHKEGDGG